MLITKDVNINSKYKGASPLHMAARHGTIEMILLLVEQGASMVESDRTGYVPFNICCSHQPFDGQ